jgi:flavin reductase (DIM6/NTAB) family NADH-FMN oxidoreductase RutF
MGVQRHTKQTRQALRQIASGVAVLTYWSGDEAHGTTVSSVTSVSRDPLLIGACLRRDSRFAQLVATPGQRFAVNVLGADQARLASWFADPSRPAGLVQFDYVDWEPDVFSGAPMITGSLARLGCQLTASFPAGDHDVLVAQVVTGTVGSGPPLLSFAGQLHDGVLRTLPARPAHPATTVGYRAASAAPAST